MTHSLSFVNVVSKHSALAPVGGEPHSCGFSYTVAFVRTAHAVAQAGGTDPMRSLSCRYSCCRFWLRGVAVSVHVVGMGPSSALWATLTMSKEERADMPVHGMRSVAPMSRAVVDTLGRVQGLAVAAAVVY